MFLSLEDSSCNKIITHYLNEWGYSAVDYSTNNSDNDISGVLLIDTNISVNDEYIEKYVRSYRIHHNNLVICVFSSQPELVSQELFKPIQY